MLTMCEGKDSDNDGRVSLDVMVAILGELSKSFDKLALRRILGQVADSRAKVNYLELIDNMTAMGNRKHNPLHKMLGRIELFLAQNKLSAQQMLERVNPQKPDNVTVAEFAQFMKRKIEKDDTLDAIKRRANQIDVDKDGVISADDLQACLRNVNSSAIALKGGTTLQGAQFGRRTDKARPIEQLDETRIVQLVDQIRQGLAKKGFDNKENDLQIVFSGFDTGRDGLLTLEEWTMGVRSFLPDMSAHLLERVFNAMDVNGIGQVDFERFKKTL